MPPVLSRPSGGRVDYARVRHAFSQLAEGVHALHEGGMLHRDLKPSNVLVTHEGRVVILDFGLAQESRPDDTQSVTVQGTPAYMSPEHASGLGTSEASDWYMRGRHVVRSHHRADAVPRLVPRGAQGQARAVSAAAERSRHAACRAISTRSATICCSPKRRVGQAAATCSRVSAVEAGTLKPAAAPSLSSRRGPTLVGRGRHLAALDEAFQASRGGQAEVVFVRGRSGMGKTALVRRFLRDVRQRDAHAVTLVGRCYERESVPYKALDTIVDAVAQHLKPLGASEADAVLPRDVMALARLFPVLREVEAVASGRHRHVEIPDAQELRRRAFGALRELLNRLSDRNPLVLFIDDMQWGDLDSCALLADLLEPPDPPALLLIVAYRSDEERNPVLQTFVTAMQRAHPAGSLRDVEVGELEPADVRELATTLLGGGEATSARIEAIAREAGGSPFFVDALARYASVAPAAGPGEMTIEHLIRARIAQLPDEARRLLDVIAVASGPLNARVAGAAAGLPADDPTLIELLRGRRLVRTRASAGPDDVETYHDRIRETVIAALSKDALAAYHRRLATALEASAGADPERLATHFRYAGQIDKAGHYFAVAAGGAADALAFDRAARLYQLAIESEPGRADLQTLRVGRATALANAGRGADAGSAYLEAAASASRDDGYDLTRRAAEQFLVSGHIDEGLAVLRTVLESVGLKLAETPRQAIVSLVAQRIALAVRGLKFHERRLSELDPVQVRQIDACWSVAVGLGMVDNARASDFQARHVRLALRAGEPYRVARAIAMDISSRADRRRPQSRVDRTAHPARARPGRSAPPSPHHRAREIERSGRGVSLGRLSGEPQVARRCRADLQERVHGRDVGARHDVHLLGLQPQLDGRLGRHGATAAGAPRRSRRARRQVRRGLHAAAQPAPHSPRGRQRGESARAGVARDLRLVAAELPDPAFLGSGREAGDRLLRRQAGRGVGSHRIGLAGVSPIAAQSHSVGVDPVARSAGAQRDRAGRLAGREEARRPRCSRQPSAMRPRSSASAWRGRRRSPGWCARTSRRRAAIATGPRRWPARRTCSSPASTCGSARPPRGAAAARRLAAPTAAPRSWPSTRGWPPTRSRTRRA